MIVLHMTFGIDSAFFTMPSCVVTGTEVVENSPKVSERARASRQSSASGVDPLSPPVCKGPAGLVPGFGLLAKCVTGVVSLGLARPRCLISRFLSTWDVWPLETN